MSTSHISPVLLVEDTAPTAMIYQEYLLQAGYDVVIADTGHKAMQHLNMSSPSAIILDLLLPNMNGLEILTRAQELYPQLPVIVMTINNSLDVVIEAMRHGAYDFIVKPFAKERLVTTLQKALEYKAIVTELKEWRQVVGQERYHGFIGQSPIMQSIYRTIEAVAVSKTSVFICGENGTGKELAAQALHDVSPRRNKPFMTMNCATIPANLMESSLFGHVKGAFTGATHDHIGIAKAVHGGTLFLDEICEMPIELQTKLLRFAQTGEIMPVGSHKTECVDVRLVCATNRDPLEEVRQRRFREDLYYRLHIVPIDMPPLRDREDDILLLANYFLARYSAEENKNFNSLSPEVISLMRRYDWPGNVRQLENVIRNVTVLHDGFTVTENMLPKDLKNFADKQILSAANQNFYDLVLVDNDAMTDDDIKPLWIIEKEAIMRALDLTEHDIMRTASLLEISPSTLYRKLQLWRYSKPNGIPSAAIA